MKKDWSAIRITLLLYLIVVVVPLNYYFTKKYFDSMQNDAATLNNLVFISGALPTLSNTEDLNERNTLISKIDSSLETVEQKFINFPPNKEYVNLFLADDVFNLFKQSYAELKESLKNAKEIKISADKTSIEINAFSTTAQEMMSYKIEVALDNLYISIAFTTLLIIVLIFIVRTYIRLQFFKHTIYDYETGLYNKKYFDSVLKKSQLLAVREGKPLSLLILFIANYNELSESSNKKELEKLATIFGHFFRHSDTVCRIEKDCFASITPDASLANIEKLSDKLQQEFKSKFSSDTIKINLCIGVATCTENSSISLLEEAKKNMQNCSVIKVGGAS